jgi:hypothetical protein
MDIVKMERNCLGDTRTATHMPTREEFREANWSHKDDVLNLAVAFASELRSRVGNHDWTKVQAPYDEMFYELMKSTIEDGADFMDGEWARLHYDVLERHHLSRHCPSDVTLFDVLEMLFDCVSAGMTRSGSVYPIEISNEILQKAVSNTVDYLVKHIEVADRKTEPQTEKPYIDIETGILHWCGWKYKRIYEDEPQTEEPPMDEYYKDHDEFYEP